MLILINEASPVISILGRNYAVRLGSARAESNDEPDLFAVTAFDLRGDQHLAISRLFTTKEEAQQAYECGFEVKSGDDRVVNIVAELLTTGAATQLA